MARTSFLINLKNKTTGGFVDAIVKTSLGPFCQTTPRQVQWQGEKFVPSQHCKKEGTPAVSTRTGPSTIEREAKIHFGNSNGTAFLLLGCHRTIETFEYTSGGGLVLQAALTRDCQESLELDVGCHASQPSLQIGTETMPRWKPNPNTVRDNSQSNSGVFGRDFSDVAKFDLFPRSLSLPFVYSKVCQTWSTGKENTRLCILYSGKHGLNIMVAQQSPVERLKCSILSSRLLALK